MSIGNEDIKKLARLTRLALSEQEEAEAVSSLNAVLGLIDQLKNADISDVESSGYVQLHGTTLRTRPPEATSGYPADTLMQNAPQADNNYFLVPRVIE